MTTDSSKTSILNNRWFALCLLCAGVLMIQIDTTIVNVALPTIRLGLGFSDLTVAWVINIYMLTFGGFLLLGGRLGDLYGHRRLILIGLAVFTLASLACGLSTTRLLLIVARLVQGIGGAIVMAVAMSLIIDLFTEPSDRAKAMGVYTFVCAGGAGLGLMLGGVLTTHFGWSSIFLVNVPIGILVVLLALKVLPTVHNSLSIPLDVSGALSVTAGLMLLMYAITQANTTGFLAPQTLAMFGVSVVLLVTFLVIQMRSRAPLMPLGLFRQRNFSTANVVMICWSTSIYGWFFLCSLYMHGVLHYSPTQIGFGYLPCPLLISAFGLGLSAKVIARFGTRLPIVVGMALCAIAYVLFAHAGADAQYVRDIFPTMVLTGLGSGLMFSPTLLSAMNDMGADESGLASGLVNTSMMMGGAVGVAILASIAGFRSSHLLAAGASALEATNGGYHLTSFVAAALCVVGALLGAVLLRHDATAPVVATVTITH